MPHPGTAAPRLSPVMGTEALHGATPQGCMRTLGAQTAPSANRWVRSRHQAQISTSFSLCCCAGIHKPGSVDSTSCIACRRIVGGGDSPPASAGLSVLCRRHRCRRHRCQAPASLAHVAAFSCPLKYLRLPPEQQSAPPRPPHATVIGATSRGFLLHWT